MGEGMQSAASIGEFGALAFQQMFHFKLIVVVGCFGSRGFGCPACRTKRLAINSRSKAASTDSTSLGM